ncbi:head-tail adaptor protein [Devosia rhodophyticola]|uniref:Head-tail adaptor protein n=1 Tax=Devosia rhodophyticola TaxID=3026423 RepID=A0ABY7YWP8_9HYPH|nr:head-tail adaptor protein [Devosia rhodophyticola]WDR05627.1 head-tail adaptor protein [Devosia rhodophyticola]
MRSGSLTHTVNIERAARTVEQSGAVAATWMPLFTLKAAIDTFDKTEIDEPFGEAADALVIFSMRYRPGVTTDDRLIYQDEAFHIRAIRLIGRREMQLKAERAN